MCPPGGPGRGVRVLGPNGAGKTTFLRMLFGLSRPDGGTLKVFGRSWESDGVRALDGVAGSPVYWAQGPWP